MEYIPNIRLAVAGNGQSLPLPVKITSYATGSPCDVWAVNEPLASSITVHFQVYVFEMAIGVLVWYSGEEFSIHSLPLFMFVFTLPKFCLLFFISRFLFFLY